MWKNTVRNGTSKSDRCVQFNHPQHYHLVLVKQDNGDTCSNWLSAYEGHDCGNNSGNLKIRIGFICESEDHGGNGI